MPTRIEFEDRAKLPPMPPPHPDGRRPRRGRPRDPDEAEALIKVCIAAAEHWEKSGRLIQVGPRRYEYHIVSMRKDDE
jgi:hypothetical protein